MSYTNFDVKDAQNVAVNTDQPRELFKLFTTCKFIDALPALTIGGGVNWEGGNYTATTNPITQAPERLEQGAFALVHLTTQSAKQSPRN